MDRLDEENYRMVFFSFAGDPILNLVIQLSRDTGSFLRRKMLTNCVPCWKEIEPDISEYSKYRLRKREAYAV